MSADANEAANVRSEDVDAQTRTNAKQPRQPLRIAGALLALTGVEVVAFADANPALYFAANGGLILIGLSLIAVTRLAPRRRAHRSTMNAASGAAKPAVEGGQQPARLAWYALFAFALVVAASSFALTYHGLYGYGRQVAQLGGFAWLAPVAVDGATVCAIAATFLLAHAPLRVRAYAWAVFLATNGLSVLGNLAFAERQHLNWQGSVGAGAWPVLVTLVAHLGIVAWRWSPRFSQHTTAAVPAQPAAASQPRSPASVDLPARTSPAPVTGPIPRPAPPKPAAPSRGRRGGGAAHHPARARALALLDEGKRPAEVALAVGVSKRTVEIWRKERDDQHKHDQEGAS